MFTSIFHLDVHLSNRTETRLTLLTFPPSLPPPQLTGLTSLRHRRRFLFKNHGYSWARWTGLPTTVADFAKIFDGTKFFRYFQPNICTLLMDISEFGLQAVPGLRIQAGPRFYMRHLEQVWFLLFVTGSRDCISRNGDYFVKRTDGEIEDDEAEHR